MEDGRAVDVVYLDFFKSFNPVSQYIPIGKLRNWGLNEWMRRLIENRLNWRSQKVFINGTGSSWRPVTSDVPKVQYWAQYCFTYASMTWMKGQMPPSKFQVVHEPAVTLWLRRPMYGTSGVLCPILNSVQERHGAPGLGPVEDNKSNEGTGSSALQGKAKGAGPVQPQGDTGSGLVYLQKNDPGTPTPEKTKVMKDQQDTAGIHMMLISSA
ncbi:hypothetical protein DUI87_12961 [Hirundo rustica rustica]|uniref:Reverse transcriptase domain-containing protein n=1 Tax=Hirundo rustica rustica TaxID=333673 RepID=A0A3M0KAK9_HIRRU|nr:hypothetical protein DUI87_12961 [Hirundo rustica rustica]